MYTPATNLTNRIMVHFNETFQQFDDLNRVLKSLATGINQLDDLRRLTANLSTLLDNPFYQDFIQLFLLQDSTLTISDVKNYLVLLESITALKNDWSYYGGLLGTFKNVFSCFEVDRFVAVETETELEQQAAQLFSNGTLLIGIVFENVKSDDLTIPPDFAVKIRTNPDNVPETNIIRPWYVTLTCLLISPKIFNHYRIDRIGCGFPDRPIICSWTCATCEGSYKCKIYSNVRWAK